MCFLPFLLFTLGLAGPRRCARVGSQHESIRCFCCSGWCPPLVVSPSAQRINVEWVIAFFFFFLCCTRPKLHLVNSK